MRDENCPIDRLAVACRLCEIIRGLDGPLFREQRLWLDKQKGDLEMTLGLGNLLDDIADLAYECFGKDCLLDGEQSTSEYEQQWKDDDDEQWEEDDDDYDDDEDDFGWDDDEED